MASVHHGGGGGGGGGLANEHPVLIRARRLTQRRLELGATPVTGVLADTLHTDTSSASGNDLPLCTDALAAHSPSTLRVENTR